ncbi:MAG: Crp/Fnr family transcriptional regulator [Trueperaceae bacterium]|nr:MAG: Crp/Fnr family transcriptional regulator [Trueperaceae bacterium]
MQPFKADPRFSEAPEGSAFAGHAAMERTYRKGETIFHACDEAADLHTIQRGLVKLVKQAADGSERIVALLGPGELIGTAFLIAGSSYEVDAVALSEVETHVIGREPFMRLALETPQVALELAEKLTAQISQARQQLTRAVYPVNTRLAQVLLQQCERFGTSLGRGWCKLQTGLKHEELASVIGATRVSVSMAMAELRQAGVVVGSRGDYLLHLPGLRVAAEENGFSPPPASDPWPLPRMPQ